MAQYTYQYTYYVKEDHIISLGINCRVSHAEKLDFNFGHIQGFSSCYVIYYVIV